MLVYIHSAKECTDLTEELEGFKEFRNGMGDNMSKYFERAVTRVNNKIEDYSRISIYTSYDHLRSHIYTPNHVKKDYLKILNELKSSGQFETVTLYQILRDLKYDPFDGYAGNIKYKSIQQIILDNQDAFVPWFRKWGITYAPPIKDLKQFNEIWCDLYDRMEFIMSDACENLYWIEHPLRPFVEYGIEYLTNNYDTPEHWVWDYLGYSTSPYDYVVHEFILLKNFHKLLKQFGPERGCGDIEEDNEYDTL